MNLLNPNHLPSTPSTNTITLGVKRLVLILGDTTQFTKTSFTVLNWDRFKNCLYSEFHKVNMINWNTKGILEKQLIIRCYEFLQESIEGTKNFLWFLGENRRHIFHFHQGLYWTIYSPFCSTTFCHFSGNFIILSSQNFLSFWTKNCLGAF